MKKSIKYGLGFATALLGIVKSNNNEKKSR